MHNATGLRSARPRWKRVRELHCLRRGMSAGLPCLLWQRFGATAYRRPLSLHRPDAERRSEGSVSTNIYRSMDVVTAPLYPPQTEKHTGGLARFHLRQVRTSATATQA